MLKNRIFITLVAFLILAFAEKLSYVATMTLHLHTISQLTKIWVLSAPN